MKIAFGGLFLASVLITASCAQTFARHDVFERSDSRIGLAVSTARRTCQARQPKQALPSAGEYERCVLDALRDDDDRRD